MISAFSFLFFFFYKTTPDTVFSLQINNYKNYLGISSLSCPGNSPDLNIIEHIWAIMKRRLQHKEARNIKELKKQIEDVWNNINLCLKNNLYQSLPKRIIELLLSY